MSLINGIDENFIKQDLVETLVRFANDQGAKVIAEGVEYEQEYEWSGHSECISFRDFYLHRPQQLPDDFEGRSAAPSSSSRPLPDRVRPSPRARAKSVISRVDRARQFTGSRRAVIAPPLASITRASRERSMLGPMIAGTPKHRGLDHRMEPRIVESAAHVRNVGKRVQIGEQAHRVDEDDVGSSASGVDPARTSSRSRSPSARASATCAPRSARAVR